MDRLRLEAPAKVNFGLRIRGRRADGYHLLESLFLPLEWGDAVEAACGAGEGVDLRVVGEEAAAVPADARNLAWRAAEAFRAASGRALRVEVTLHKCLPAGAGLGGGSSDAAAVLRALAALRPGAVPLAELERLALGLGADVPFFLDPRPAWVTGIGEHRAPVPGVPRIALLLAHPGPPLATAEVYAAYDTEASALTPGGPVPTLREPSRGRDDAASGRERVAELLRRLAAGLPAAGLADALRNDLESAAAGLRPAVAALRKEMEAVGAVAVGLSGSGPTLFGVFPSEAAARAAAGRLRTRPPAWSRVTATRPSDPGDQDPDAGNPDAGTTGASPNW